MAAFDILAFSSDAFDTGNVVFTFPTSFKDPNLMQVLGRTNTETLLSDFSDSETFYVLATSPEVSIPTLFTVSNSFARQWFGVNGGNNLRVLFNPFLNLTY
jgi:hypothetical protein